MGKENMAKDLTVVRKKYTFTVKFKYDDDIIRLVKEMKGTYTPATKEWELHNSKYDEFRARFINHNIFETDENVKLIIKLGDNQFTIDPIVNPDVFTTFMPLATEVTPDALQFDLLLLKKVNDICKIKKIECILE